MEDEVRKGYARLNAEEDEVGPEGDHQRRRQDQPQDVPQPSFAAERERIDSSPASKHHQSRQDKSREEPLLPGGHRHDRPKHGQIEVVHERRCGQIAEDVRREVHDFRDVSDEAPALLDFEIGEVKRDEHGDAGAHEGQGLGEQGEAKQTAVDDQHMVGHVEDHAHGDHVSEVDGGKHLEPVETREPCQVPPALRAQEAIQEEQSERCPEEIQELGVTELPEPERREAEERSRHERWPELARPVIRETEHAQTGERERQEQHDVVAHDRIARQQVTGREDGHHAEHMLGEGERTLDGVEDVGVEEVQRVAPRQSVNVPGENPREHDGVQRITYMGPQPEDQRIGFDDGQNQEKTAREQGASNREPVAPSAHRR